MESPLGGVRNFEALHGTEEDHSRKYRNAEVVDGNFKYFDGGLG
jgi:hypothetical protein